MSGWSFSALDTPEMERPVSFAMSLCVARFNEGQLKVVWTQRMYKYFQLQKSFPHQTFEQTFEKNLPSGEIIFQNTFGSRSKFRPEQINTKANPVR
jgi:hypothetical protein